MIDTFADVGLSHGLIIIPHKMHLIKCNSVNQLKKAKGEENIYIIGFLIIIIIYYIIIINHCYYILL